MKTPYHLNLIASLMLLSACAATPEQKAEFEAKQRRQAQQLQVALAEQCDAETAQLMQRHFMNDTGVTDKEKQDFRLAYVEKVNDKMFQACYKMAWQSHIAQQRLNDLRWRDYDDWWYGPRWGRWWW